MSAPLRFAIFGTGFWARFQLAAWRELPGAECVALYNRTRAKAEALAREFGVPAVYDDPETLLDAESPDFIDIITDVDSHARFAAEQALGAEVLVGECSHQPHAELPIQLVQRWRTEAPAQVAPHR